jgi:hypothetical protein
MINLYIDHQNVAPLIYSLEDILDKALQQTPDIGMPLITQVRNISFDDLYMKPSQTSSTLSIRIAKKTSRKMGEL